MTSIVIGSRSRALSLDDRTFLSGQDLLDNFDSYADTIEKADQIIWAYYACHANGDIHFGKSVEAAQQLKRKIIPLNKKFLYLSSDAVFSSEEGSNSEENCPHPNTVYGKMKLAQEQIFSCAPRLRFTIIGPSFNSDRPLLSDLVRTNAITKLYPNQYFSPISTITLNMVIDQHRQGALENRIYHLAGSAISKEKCVRSLANIFQYIFESDFESDVSQSDLTLLSKTHNYRFSDEIKILREYYGQ